MKIQCYMPLLNEADILPHTLRHLHEEGCAVHVIDGWSTDGSYDIAQRLADSVELFPARKASPVQCCADILRRVEDLSAVSDAQWCMLNDADEWRRSPFEGATLAGTLEYPGFARYDVVDFRVFQFYCVEDGWQYDRKGRSPEEYFQHYDEADCISRIPNRKLWRNVGRVQLAGGGHEVQFRGMRVYPVKFSMKHYPFRTPAQAKAKIATRLARRCAGEHAKGWGVHYDQYPPGFEFCWDPAQLKFWRDTRTLLP
jgi:hypothetical protein